MSSKGIRSILAGEYKRQAPLLSAAFVGILSCAAVALLTMLLGSNGKALIAASVAISVLMFAFVFVLSVDNLRHGSYREAVRLKGEVFGCFTLLFALVTITQQATGTDVANAKLFVSTLAFPFAAAASAYKLSLAWHEFRKSLNGSR